MRYKIRKRCLPGKGARSKWQGSIDAQEASNSAPRPSQGFRRRQGGWRLDGDSVTCLAARWCYFDRDPRISDPNSGFARLSAEQPRPRNCKTRKQFDRRGGGDITNPFYPEVIERLTKRLTIVPAFTRCSSTWWTVSKSRKRSLLCCSIALRRQCSSQRHTLRTHAIFVLPMGSPSFPV